MAEQRITVAAAASPLSGSSPLSFTILFKDLLHHYRQCLDLLDLKSFEASALSYSLSSHEFDGLLNFVNRVVELDFSLLNFQLYELDFDELMPKLQCLQLEQLSWCHHEQVGGAHCQFYLSCHSYPDITLIIRNVLSQHRGCLIGWHW